MLGVLLGVVFVYGRLAALDRMPTPPPESRPQIHLAVLRGRLPDGLDARGGGLTPFHFALSSFRFFFWRGGEFAFCLPSVGISLFECLLPNVGGAEAPGLDDRFP